MLWKRNRFNFCHMCFCCHTHTHIALTNHSSSPRQNRQIPHKTTTSNSNKKSERTKRMESILRTQLRNPKQIYSNTKMKRNRRRRSELGLYNTMHGSIQYIDRFRCMKTDENGRERQAMQTSSSVSSSSSLATSMLKMICSQEQRERNDS